MVVAQSQGAGGDGDLESRYAHLVKPIRDLTKNWQMNIAAELAEYLEEIGSIQITFDGGATTMNFAEAALLIQGSACIYSKKVEYLYTLVNQMLDLLASKKKMQAAGSVDAQGGDADATFARKKHQEDEFLSLDDIKEHKNLDINEEGQLASVTLIQRVPIALLPLADSEKGQHPLLSTKGEVLGNRKDFRMNTSIVHMGGTLLLDLSNIDMLDMSFHFKPHSTPFPTRTQEAAKETDAAKDVTQQLNIDEDEGLPNLSMDDNNDMAFEPPESDTVVHQQPLEEGGEQRSKQAAKQTRRSLGQLPKPTFDALKIKGIHSNTGSKEKAYKKCKTHRIPAQLNNSTRKRKRDKEVDRSNDEQIILTFLSKNVRRSREKVSSRPMKVTTFSEFEFLYWKEFQKRQAKDRNNRKKMVEQGRLQEVIAEAEEQEEQQGGLEADFPAAGTDGDDYDDAQIAAIGGLSLADDNLPPLFDPQHSAHLPTDDIVAAYEDNLVVTSYEELVRNHVEGFMASAQQYAQTTDLHKRVREWEEKVLPVLQMEDERDPFDIHKYGTDILQGVDKNVKKILDCTEHRQSQTKENEVRVPFRKVVENKQSFQVCRLFLATLQLANNYNVEVEREHMQMDTMTLRLLSTARHHEQLADYQAPSLDNRSQS